MANICHSYERMYSGTMTHCVDRHGFMGHRQPAARARCRQYKILCQLFAYGQNAHRN